MIDCHSHILPAFDDGAADIEMSLKMLSESKRQGVEKIISTSHCYPKKSNDMLSFITKRNESLLLLKKEIQKRNINAPKIYPGCELNMTIDVSECEETRLLCINETDYILIELPLLPWKEWMIDAVYKLTVQGYKPIIAHIDRYFQQDHDLLSMLFEQDVLYQISGEAFLSLEASSFTSKLMSEGRAHIIGSDMHNITNRPQNMQCAYKAITKNYGEECLEYFNTNAQKILNGEEISYAQMRSFKRKSFFGRIFGNG